MKTQDKEYAGRLYKNQYVWWKRFLDVQAPYRCHLRRMHPGFVLDIGCGIGRNLIHLDGNGVGIDHNTAAVEIARNKGLQVFTPEDFHKSEYNIPLRFDSILLAHVAEHMTEQEVVNLLKTYFPLLKNNGNLIIITPQEKGYDSDATHVQFVDFDVQHRIIKALNLEFVRQYSFPFPRFFGSFFKYNEFIGISRKSG